MTITCEFYSAPLPAHIRRELCEIHEETLPADSLPTFRRDNAMVAVTDQAVVGYVTYRRVRGRLWIDRIGVMSEFRGEGLAGRLLDFALWGCSNSPADTYIAALNVPSQRLFISRGFVPFDTFTADKQLFIRFSTCPRKPATK